MTLWLIILGMVIVTYGVRLSVIVLLGEASLPHSVNRALRFVPAAALSSIIFPELFMPQNRLDVSFGNVRLLAGIVAALIAWRTRSALLAIGVGMALLWIGQGLGG